MLRSRGAKGVLLAVAALLLSSLSWAQPFKLRAVSSDPGPGLRIVMIWPHQLGVSRYNIYRKEGAAGPYPATPLHSSPIAAAPTCTALKAILPEGSAEWDLLKKGLAEKSTPFDPCLLPTVTPGSEKHDRLLQLARANLKIAKAVGLAYEDAAVTNGKTYFYKIAIVDSSGSVVAVLDEDVQVTAGVFTLPPAPAGLVAEAGDNQILTRWNGVEGAAGFHVRRSLNPLGPYVSVNPSGYTVQVTQTLSGTPLTPSTNGFLDFRRWTSSGKPTTHVVNGITVSGPVNGTTYFYKVASVDLLGRAGPATALPVSATPKDATAPAAPTAVLVTPDETTSSFIVKWQHVVKDVEGHEESSPVNKYRLYRYESSGDPNVGAVLVHPSIPPPPPKVLGVTSTDSSSGLRSDFEDKTWWYRIEAIDGSGNVSARSAAVSGTLKDVTKPKLVKNAKADGLEEGITLRWTPNSDPDLESYAIYRSQCDYGKWVECTEEPVHIAVPVKKPCSGPFIYLGEVFREDALKALAAGKPIYEDKTVPPGDPTCHAYWIKAKDKSGNLSGGWPKPWAPDEKNGIVCQRLRDKTGPDPALIAGLYARDQAILVEWVGPPTQDIRAYHVYRAEKDDPTAYAWIGGMTVEPPPAPPVPLTSKYVAPAVVGCDVIPVAINKAMSAGSLEDKTAEPKKPYWYKVVGIDYDGNEGAVKEAVGVSTFTFTSAKPTTPSITLVEPKAEADCALVVSWNPAFQALQHKGFVVFKSRSPAGPYTQAAGPVGKNSYMDSKVVKGVEYWYRIGLLDREGVLSELSAPKSGKVIP